MSRALPKICQVSGEFGFFNQCFDFRKLICADRLEIVGDDLIGSQSALLAQCHLREKCCERDCANKPSSAEHGSYLEGSLFIADRTPGARIVLYTSVKARFHFTFP